MSRRDTIVIALLANICLLALLFVLATNTGDDVVDTAMSSQIADVNSSIPTSKPIATDRSIADEMDDFLKELPKEEIGQPIFVDEDGYIELEKFESTPIVKPAAEPEIVSTTDVNYVNVTVKSGDALERIARNNGTTVEAIKKANNMTSTKLSIGQVLRVPISKETSSSTPKTASTSPGVQNTEKKPTTNTDPKYYTIKNGDSLWKIARDLQVKSEDIMQMNGLDEEKARNLKIGDKIRVR